MQAASDFEHSISHLMPPSPWTASCGHASVLNAETFERRMGMLRNQLIQMHMAANGKPFAYLMSRVMFFRVDIKGEYIARPLLSEARGIGA